MVLPKSKNTLIPATPTAAEKTVASVRRRAVSESTPAPAVMKKRAADAKKSEGDLKKEKRVRSDFSLSESQFSLLAELKTRCLSFGISAKKSELLAAGLHLLKGLSETALEVSILPCLKSDRKPVKSKNRRNKAQESFQRLLLVER